jgi:hypothetical protein
MGALLGRSALLLRALQTAEEMTAQRPHREKRL